MKKTLYRIRAALPIVAAALTVAAPAFAAGQPAIVGQATRLLQDVSGWLLGLIPAGTTAALGWQALQKQLSDGDPNTIAQINHKMRNTLIGGAIGTGAAGIASAFLSYFR